MHDIRVPEQFWCLLTWLEGCALAVEAIWDERLYRNDDESSLGVYHSLYVDGALVLFPRMAPDVRYPFCLVDLADVKNEHDIAWIVGMLGQSLDDEYYTQLATRLYSENYGLDDLADVCEFIFISDRDNPKLQYISIIALDDEEELDCGCIGCTAHKTRPHVMENNNEIIDLHLGTHCWFSARACPMCRENE